MGFNNLFSDKEFKAKSKAVLIPYQKDKKYIQNKNDSQYLIIFP